MPDFTAHHLLGEEVLRLLPENGSGTAARVPEAFCWGLQGPDPLFYGGKQLSRLGSQLHREKPEKLLHLLFQQTVRARGRRREILTSYLLGFLCHYAMDARLHPYIYSMEKRLRAARPQRWWSALHGEIECRMDEQLYRMKTGKPVTCFRPDGYRPSPPTLAVLCRLYHTLLYQLTGTRIHPSRIAGAFRRCLQISQLVYMPLARIGRPALRLLEQAAGYPGVFSNHVKLSSRRAKDILNLQHAAWQDFSTPGAERFESVPELFAAAAQDACRLCKKFLTALEEGHFPRLPPLPGFDAGNFKKAAPLKEI